MSYKYALYGFITITIVVSLIIVLINFVNISSLSSNIEDLMSQVSSLKNYHPISNHLTHFENSVKQTSSQNVSDLTSNKWCLLSLFEDGEIKTVNSNSILKHTLHFNDTTNNASETESDNTEGSDMPPRQIQVSGHENCNTWSAHVGDLSDNYFNFKSMTTDEMLCKDDTVGFIKYLTSKCDYCIIFPKHQWESKTLYVKSSEYNVSMKFSELKETRVVHQKLLEGGFYGLETYDEKRYQLDPLWSSDLSNKEGHMCTVAGLKHSVNKVSIHMWGSLCEAVAWEVSDDPVIVYGRPLMIQGQQQLSDVLITNNETQSSGWGVTDLKKTLIGELDNMSDTEKDVFQKKWLGIAKLEHSSIASFARVIIELMSYGAPYYIIKDTIEALSDELRHADTAISLSKAVRRNKLDKEHYSLSKLLQTGVIKIRDKATFLKDNNRDAIVGEAESAEKLISDSAEALLNNRPGFSALLSSIGTDEDKHAELGLKIQNWLNQ